MLSIDRISTKQENSPAASWYEQEIAAMAQGDMQALENAVRDVADSNWRADPKKMVRFDKDTVYQGYVKLYENVLSTLGKGRVMAT